MTTLPIDALLGNRNFLEPIIGFEPVTRAVRLVLSQGLNDEIDRHAEAWMQQDLALQSMGFDPGVGQVEVEHVPDDHLHEGPHESLIEAPPEAFPNCTMMAYVSRPSGSQFDQFDNIDITLFIETMVIAGPVPEGQETAYETIVHRRITRTTEAVAATIRRSGNILGSVLPIQLPPVGAIGDATWLRRKDKGIPGPRYLWHGSRLQYTLQRAAAIN